MPPTGIAPEPDAGVILEELAVLGIARLLDSEDASTRVELTIIPKSEIVAEDLDSHASREHGDAARDTPLPG